MKKKNYSMTAKERKAMRAPEPIDERTPEEIEAEARAAADKRKRRNRILLGCLICVLAAALIALAVILPILAARNKYSYVKNPVAVIELDNGMTMRYEIFEDSCPVAATNFLFLAKVGYFDGTIIFDSQNSWVRFGGFTGTASKAHRMNDEEFCAKVSGLNERGTPPSKFKYRLKQDTSKDATGLLGQKGVLTFLRQDTATEFQVAAIDNAQTDVPGTSSYRNMTAVGRALDDETLANIAAITALNRLTKDESEHSVWRAPYIGEDTGKLIRIKKVKLYNMSKSKWKHFNFETYMSTALDGKTAISN